MRLFRQLLKNSLQWQLVIMNIGYPIIRLTFSFLLRWASFIWALQVCSVQKPMEQTIKKATATFQIFNSLPKMYRWYHVGQGGYFAIFFTELSSSNGDFLLAGVAFSRTGCPYVFIQSNPRSRTRGPNYIIILRHAWIIKINVLFQLSSRSLSTAPSISGAIHSALHGPVLRPHRKIIPNESKFFRPEKSF